MGKISNGILGGFSGTLGPAVGSSWKGIQVIRSRPPRKRGYSSPGQLAQMAKMSVISSFLQPLTGLLNSIYNSVTVRMSCFNKALSYNIRNAIAGDYPSFTVNYEQVILGRGDLLNVLMPKAGSLSKGTVTFSWTDNSGVGSARATDQAFVAVYCEAIHDWETSGPDSQRNAGSYTLDVTAFSGKEVQTYIGFVSSDGRFVSTSLYAGPVNIL